MPVTAPKLTDLRKVINGALFMLLRDIEQPCVPNQFRREGYIPSKGFPFLLTIQGPTNLTRGWVRVYDPTTETAYCAPFVGREATRVGTPYPVKF